MLSCACKDVFERHIYYVMSRYFSVFSCGQLLSWCGKAIVKANLSLNLRSYVTWCGKANFKANLSLNLRSHVTWCGKANFKANLSLNLRSHVTWCGKANFKANLSLNLRSHVTWCHKTVFEANLSLKLRSHVTWCHKTVFEANLSLKLRSQPVPAKMFLNAIFIMFCHVLSRCSFLRVTLNVSLRRRRKPCLVCKLCYFVHMFFILLLIL